MNVQQKYEEAARLISDYQNADYYAKCKRDDALAAKKSFSGTDNGIAYVERKMKEAEEAERMAVERFQRMACSL